MFRVFLIALLVPVGAYAEPLTRPLPENRLARAVAGMMLPATEAEAIEARDTLSGDPTEKERLIAEDVLIRYCNLDATGRPLGDESPRRVEPLCSAE